MTQRSPQAPSQPPATTVPGRHDADQALRDTHESLRSRLRDIQQVAVAAGHGFGHQPLGAPRNAGWTDLDLSDNCRPAYDAQFLRAFNPDVIAALIGRDDDRPGAPAGGSGMLGVLVRHYPTSDGRCNHDSLGTVAYPCPEVTAVEAFFDSVRGAQSAPRR